MALALAQYDDLFQLVRGYLYGIRMACQIRYRTISTLMCIAMIELCHSTWGSYVCLPSESNGPNLLDEPLKRFIVIPACLPWKCFGSNYLGRMGIMTHSESVQPLQSVKLVYQSCSWSRAALEPLWNSGSLKIICLCYSLFMFTLIMCFSLGLKQLVATLTLKW